MRFHPYSESIGKDEVTYFSMVSSPKHDALHQSIGRIAVEFGKLEYLVKVAIERLSREIAARNGLPESEIGFTEGMLQAERTPSQLVALIWRDYIGCGRAILNGLPASNI